MQPLKSRLSCRAVPRRFDGVGGIEQCPILPGKRMTIRFRVNEMPGTYQVRYRASKTLTVGNSAEPDHVLFSLCTHKPCPMNKFDEPLLFAVAYLYLDCAVARSQRRRPHGRPGGTLDRAPSRRPCGARQV